MKRSASECREERFSGHESFCCRYGWLPKFVHGIVESPNLFESDENAMLQLGIGRNMVRSIRFWAEAFGVAHGGRTGQYWLTEFGSKLMHPETGTDPFLEDHASLWLLHWRITTDGRLGAWSVAFDEYIDLELERGEFEALVGQRTARNPRQASASTIRQHCDIFLKTYADRTVALRNESEAEESLGAPWQELRLFNLSTRSGRGFIRFNRGPKRALTCEVFAKALWEFWQKMSPTSVGLPLLSLAGEKGSPGRAFKLTLSATAELARAAAHQLEDILTFEDDVVRSGLLLRPKATLDELGDAVGGL